MKHHKTRFIFFLFFISYGTILNAHKDLYECSSMCLSAPLVDSEHREYLEIREEIAQFIVALVEDATNENRVEELPQELVRCYKKIVNDERILPSADLAVSLPVMFNYLGKISSELSRAPRPDNSNIVGPLVTQSLTPIILLLEQLQQQLALCCATITSEFQQTWTILAHLSTTTVDLSGVFTALAALSSPCSPISITTPTLITQPGFYCLANDIHNTLTVAGPDIKVDLNHHNINAPGAPGIFVNGAVNTVIMNGTIFNTANGLELNNTSSSIFRDLTILNSSVAGIQLDTVQSGIVLQDIIIDTVNGFGIGQSNFIGELVNSTLLNITVRNCSTVIGGAFSLPTSVACIFNNCQVLDSVCSGGFLVGSETVLTNCLIMNCAIGIVGFQANNNDTLFANCSIIGVTLPTGGRGFSPNNNAILQNCSAIDLTASTGGVSAFSIAANNVQCSNCSAINIQSQTGANGFSINATNIILENCLVQTCSSLSNFTSNNAFFISAFDCALLGCQAEQSAGYGFFVSSGNTIILQRCLATANSIDGFNCQNILPSLGYCSSFNNGGAGFNIAAPGITMYGCFASHNTTNYINGTNVQPAATAGAFANSFI